MVRRSDPMGERIAALEVEVQHLKTQVDDTHLKVEQVLALLQQAKGVRWIIITGAAIAGFIASFATNLAPWLGIGPR